MGKDKDDMNEELNNQSNNFIESYKTELEKKYIEELDNSRRELKKTYAILKSEHNQLKRKICIIANLLLPGLGYYILGKGTFKGCISFILYISAIIFYKVNNVYQEYSYGAMYFLFFIPVLLVSIISTVLMTDYLD